jgi:hypothetical protein
MVSQLNDERFVYTWVEHEGACGGRPRQSILDSLDDNRDYVCFLDDDNELYKDYLQQMVNAITEEHKLVVCKIQHDKFGVMPEPEHVTETSVTFGKIDSLCFMTTVHLAKQYSGLWIHDPMRMVTHDYDFPTAILTQTKLRYIPIILGNHGQVLKDTYSEILNEDACQILNPVEVYNYVLKSPKDKIRSKKHYIFAIDPNCHPIFKGLEPIINKMKSCDYYMVNNSPNEWIQNE